LLDPKNIPDFLGSLEEFAEATDERTEYVGRLYAAVKQMLGNATSSTSVTV
jgi:hypothetical protein